MILVLPYLGKHCVQLSYLLNKDFITQNYCINRFAPEQMCYGKCYLEKKLNDLSSENSPMALVTSDLHQDFKVIALPKTYFREGSQKIDTYIHSFRFLSPESSFLPEEIFHPPVTA